MRSPAPAPAETPAGDGRLVLQVRPALAVIAGGGALILAGLIVGGPGLTVPGAGLAVLGVLACVWVIGVAAGAGVDGRPLNATVIEGRPVRLEIAIGGPRLLGLGGAELRHPLLPEPLALAGAGARTGTWAPATPATPATSGLAQRVGRASWPTRREPRVVVLTATARRRGRAVITPPQLVISDPVGLARAVRSAGGEMGELLVLPRTEPVRWLDADATGAAALERTTVAGSEATDIVGLRDYQPGTPATRIHWPAVARGGPMLERVFASELQLAPLVVVDPRGATDPRRATPGTEPDRLDAVIRAAASLTLALAQSGMVDLMLPGRHSPLRITGSLSAWASAHRALALIEAEPATAAAPQVPTDQAGVLFYTCTDPALAETAERRWAGRFVAVAPLPVGTPVPSGALELSGCIAVPRVDVG